MILPEYQNYEYITNIGASVLFVLSVGVIIYVFIGLFKSDYFNGK